MSLRDKFSKNQCSKNNTKREYMKEIPYKSVLSNVTYLVVCTKLDITFVANVLRRYLANLFHDHWEESFKLFAQN